MASRSYCCLVGIAPEAQTAYHGKLSGSGYCLPVAVPVACGARYAQSQAELGTRDKLPCTCRACSVANDRGRPGSCDACSPLPLADCQGP